MNSEFFWKYGNIRDFLSATVYGMGVLWCQKILLTLGGYTIVTLDLEVFFIYVLIHFVFEEERVYTGYQRKLGDIKAEINCQLSDNSLIQVF